MKEGILNSLTDMRLKHIGLVLKEGLEPSLIFQNRILSPVRLPIPPFEHISEGRENYKTGFNFLREDSLNKCSFLFGA